MVAPVVVAGGGNPTQMPYFGSILQMQLAQGLKKPYFEDGGNWAKFSWEWKRYWNSLTRGLAPGAVVGDEVKLDILILV